MNILIVTDAWHPQINGVVRTIENVGKHLTNRGHEVFYLTPLWPGLKNFPVPSYPEIKIPWNVWRVGKIISSIKPDAIHIATEGTLGIAAQMFCNKRGLPFTTSYHTKTPEYIKERVHWFPLSWGYNIMKWLHKKSKAVLVTTDSMKRELEQYNFHNNMVVWTRGTDLELFHPNKGTRTEQNEPPILIYVGRVSVEKNLEAFLELSSEFTKIVVGDGPDRHFLEKMYPDTEFVGYIQGEELAQMLADSDVFVFPSKTDTFGIVMIEANACGIPVAAYPVTGPKDFVECGVNGYLDQVLEVAVYECLDEGVDRQTIRNYVEQNYSWKRCVDIFEQHLVPVEYQDW